MTIRRGSVRTYLLFIACIYITNIKEIRGEQRHPRRSLTEEDENQSSSYFFYQHADYPRDCRDIRDQCPTSLGKSRGTYVIKPYGYTEPFEVFCNNDIDSGGWTVILRRNDGSISFKRNWEDYKVGFGFLSNEHWLGNEKLSYLTNQAEYELRIDFVLSNGSSFYVKYSSFRITDEWSRFALVSSGTFNGNASLVVSECPPNMVYMNVTCQPTCDDPRGSNTCSVSSTLEAESCVCDDGFLKKGDSCVLPAACGCYVREANFVIPNNETYINTACSEKCSCKNGQLICNSNYECSPNAACRVKDNVRQCYCNEGYQGDGETCISIYEDCYAAYEAGQTQDGVYTILPNRWPGSAFNVYCDMTTSGGGWTVFQRRVDGVTDFYRNWTSYRNGFGSVQHGSDFWLGNEQLYYLTNNYQQGNNQRSYKLRIDIVTSGGSPKYDEYASFRTDTEATKYRLVDLGSHSGNAGNGMYYTSGRQFSTYDDDHDGCGNHNCADKHKGAWWHNPETTNWCPQCYGSYCYYFQYSSSCSTLCTRSNLNGDYNGGNGENIFWYYSNYCNVNSAEMKIRPNV
ncbi:Angiopoietin-related protein 1 [Holothuria leucospilota]|uniref:Angiopoietin-related protein 1 n=1 Tax=Holothuria leucospilota TaxID=206669 RepID=A0A9Q1BVZ4_HOLLE|nr:Angiopoietin-related protein 1 [Holothuria leucospilota]